MSARAPRQCKSALAALGLCLASCAGPPTRVALEFSIVQDTELILFSEYGQPAQMAIWLEDPASGSAHTLFVTRRSATGIWEGKSECPTSLPRWFEIHRAETGQPELPRPEAPALDAVTRPTPAAEEFRWTAPAEEGSRWICWIEVNLSADYNAHYPQLDEKTGAIDTDGCGQPSLLYRCELVATPGATFTPELFGRTGPGASSEVSRELAGITTARDILESIQIRVLEEMEESQERLPKSPR